jgi:RNA polymerase sigma-70 factor, ECF subfamily
VTAKNPSLEEQQAVTRLKQGNLDGMEILVRHYQVRAVYAAYLIVRDLGLAEDIVQNAFLQAAKKIHQFDERRPFGAWFLRIVINAAIKAEKQQKRFIPLDHQQNEDTDPLIDWLLDPNPGPDQVIESEETRQMVWKALERLPAEQRAAIIMRHFLEMNDTEMTQALGRPLTTVRWWLRTARNRLREALKSFWQIDQTD